LIPDGFFRVARKRHCFGVDSAKNTPATGRIMTLNMPENRQPNGVFQTMIVCVIDEASSLTRPLMSFHHRVRVAG
jgi:hypothetical protein